MALRLLRQLPCLLAGTLMCGTLLAQEPYRVAQNATRPASSSMPANAAGRAGTPRASTDAACKARWRDYQRSQDCFAPFLTVNGIKPEAFRVCGPALLDPSAECGPAPQQP